MALEKDKWKLYHRIDTAQNWQTQNTVLGKGEFGIVEDSDPKKREFKIGDGTTAWNDLPSLFGWDGESNVESVPLSDIDTLNNGQLLLKKGKVYDVTYQIGSNAPQCVGKLFIIGDTMMHVLTQIFITHCTLNAQGGFDASHDHNKIFVFFRQWNISTEPRNQWTAWKDYLSGVGGGGAGKNGTTFTPSVDAAGNLSWTNDGGKENPQPVNIKGADGANGVSLGEKPLVHTFADTAEDEQKVASSAGVARALKNVKPSGTHSVTEHMYEETVLSDNIASWTSGWIDTKGKFTEGWSCWTSDFITVIPGFSVIRFKSKGSVNTENPTISGFNLDQTFNRSLYNGGNINEYIDVYVPADIHFVKISVSGTSNHDFKKVEFGKTLIDNVHSFTDSKADLYNDFNEHLISAAASEIVKGKAVDCNGDWSQITEKTSSVVTIPLVDAAKLNYIFFFPFFNKDVWNSGIYYACGYFADSSKNIIPQGKITTANNPYWRANAEVMGGFLDYGKYRTAMGKDAAYLVLCVGNEMVDKLNIYFGENMPFFTDELHPVNCTTPLKEKSHSHNLVQDTGLTSYIGLANLDGHFEIKYEGYSDIENYIQKENDPLMLDLGIRRCVDFPAGQYITEGASFPKRQSYQISVKNVCARASQFKVYFIVEIADSEVDFLASLQIKLISIEMNLQSKFKFTSEKLKYYKHKIKDNFYLLCYYLATEKSSTESYQNRDAELYSATVNLSTTDYSHHITFHGGWMFESAWNRNTICDYSMPTFEQLKCQSLGNDIYPEIDKFKRNPWYGKSILAVGTSYMHPNSQLAERTADKIGCILHNSGNVGGRTHCKIGVPGDASSWTVGMAMTNKELQDAVNAGVDNNTNGTWMKTLELGYENLIMKYICDDNGYVDSLGQTLHRPEGYPRPSVMIVLDGQNEADQTKEEPSTFLDRSTWRGAWNYLLTEIYKVHPQLKVVFLSNPAIVGPRGLEGLVLYEATKMVVEQWSLPYVDFVTQLGVINDYRKDPDKDESGNGKLTIYKRDWGGNHYKNRCAERMAQILANYLSAFDCDYVESVQ